MEAGSWLLDCEEMGSSDGGWCMLASICVWAWLP